jgi:perosamine synthetase
LKIKRQMAGSERTFIPIARPLIEEEEKAAVLAVLESGQLAQGPQVAAFEEEFAAFCGVRHAIATSSGTTALHLALLAQRIGPGDEVITSPFTFISSANAILFAGARPVFADIEPDTFNLDPSQVEALVTPRTRAIMPVHLFGHPCDMGALLEIAAARGLVIVEDACQAHGATVNGRRVGSFGTGCFSFYPTKNMTTAEGGMITADDDEVAERARLLRNHGMRQRYYHDFIGYNFRMTDLQAALGRVQLQKLPRRTEQRVANAAYLTERLAGLDGVTPPVVRDGVSHVFHQYTVRLRGERDRAREQLRERGVGSEVYYPLPVHRQAFYREMGYDDDLPLAECASREVLSLPVHPALSHDDLDRIVEEVAAL